MTMGDLISVSKASKLLGITRSELNDRLDAANITPFEGKVDFDAVKSIAPDLSFCEENILDRVRYIRENISLKVTDNPAALSKRDLAAENQKLLTDLMVERRTSDHYERMLVELARKLGDLQTSENEEIRRVALEMCQWLREEISSE